MVWIPGEMTIACPTGMAAPTFVFPAWMAVRVIVPTPVGTRREFVPLLVIVAIVVSELVNVTGSPALEVAVIAAGVDP
jgi:hypothetical protein